MVARGLPIVALAATAAAFSPRPQKPHDVYADWEPAKEGDSRGPCPVLNSLANHGFLPRSGRNITISKAAYALKNGINVAPDIAEMAVGNAIELNPEEGADWFDLEMLNTHNTIEHDNSLSRKDKYFDGDNHSFDRETFDAWFKYFEGSDVIDIQTAADALGDRMHFSKENNPDWVLDMDGSTGTTASYIAIMGDKKSGQAVREWVRYLFENERLPTELGWTPRHDTYYLDDLMSGSKRIEKLLPKDLQDMGKTSRKGDIHSSKGKGWDSQYPMEL